MTVLYLFTEYLSLIVLTKILSFLFCGHACELEDMGNACLSFSVVFP